MSLVSSIRAVNRVNRLFLSVCSDISGVEYSVVNRLCLSFCSDVSGVEYSDADVNRL